MDVQLAQLLPVLLPALLGILVSFLTELVTKAHLAKNWKTVINLILAAAAAAVAGTRYPLSTGDWKADALSYLAAFLEAWVLSGITHKQLPGATDFVQRVTANIGVGPKRPDEIEQGVKARQAALDEQ